MCGVVQLVLGQPENQPHRADLSKMLVLDTASGEAERLYQRSGWVRVGAVPGYALWPQGGLCATTFYDRELGG